jgi:hypothetical protein
LLLLASSAPGTNALCAARAPSLALRAQMTPSRMAAFNDLLLAAVDPSTAPQTRASIQKAMRNMARVQYLIPAGPLATAYREENNAVAIYAESDCTCHRFHNTSMCEHLLSVLNVRADDQFDLTVFGSDALQSAQLAGKKRSRPVGGGGQNRNRTNPPNKHVGTAGPPAY